MSLDASSTGDVLLKPEVFHLGIPKSGSTSIQDVLSADPRIIVSRSRYYTAADWWKLDKPIESDHLVVETNETLISGGYQKVKFGAVIERIYTTNPKAKLILVIRSQPKAVLSMYKFHILNAFWGSSTFDHWLFHTDLGMDYLSICRYGNIVRQLEAFFPKEQIHLLFFEELKENPKAFYEKFYQILGVSPQIKKYSVSNKNQFSDDQLYTLSLLNRLALFKRKSENRFYFSKGHQIEQAIKFKLVRYFAKSAPQDFSSWEAIPEKDRVFEGFRKTNQMLIDLGYLTREQLLKYKYPLPE